MKDPILVIFMRTDLNMSRGKMAVQAGHAVAMTMFSSDEETIAKWMMNNQIKIVLAVNNETALDLISQHATANGVHNIKVKDAGKTEVESGTTTCLAVGIGSRARIGKITSGWKTLK